MFFPLTYSSTQRTHRPWNGGSEVLERLRPAIGDWFVAPLCVADEAGGGQEASSQRANSTAQHPR